MNLSLDKHSPWKSLRVKVQSRGSHFPVQTMLGWKPTKRERWVWKKFHESSCHKNRLILLIPPILSQTYDIPLTFPQFMILRHHYFALALILCIPRGLLAHEPLLSNIVTEAPQNKETFESFITTSYTLFRVFLCAWTALHSKETLK